MSDGNLPDRSEMFSCSKPTLGDWRETRDFLEAYSKQILLDPFEQGILRNVGNELEVTIENPDNPDTDALVDTGAAWLFDNSKTGLGQRIQIDSQQNVSLSNPATQDNIVYVKLKYTDTDSRPNYISGVNTSTEKQAGYELGAVAETSWPVANAIPLAKVGEDAGRIIVKEDLREFFILKVGFGRGTNELNIGLLLPVYETALICDDLFAVFRPDPDSLRSQIVIESLHVACAVGGITFGEPEVNIGVWDSSDKTNHGIWVDILGLTQGGVVMNEIGGQIGRTDQDHRFYVGFQVDDPSSLSITAQPSQFPAMYITMTIRYRLVT